MWEISIKNLVLLDAKEDGVRFDHADMQRQLAPTRLGFIMLNQIRRLHAHRLESGDGVDCWSFAYCIAAVLNTAPRGPVRIADRDVATWPGLDSGTLRLELAKVGIRFTGREMANLIAQVTSRRSPIGKVELGRRLQLTEAERELVDARNIQAVDHSEAAKLARAREANAKHQDSSRRRAGAVERSEWLEDNHLSRTKPWEAEGVSRATWYRRNGAEAGKNVRQVHKACEPPAEGDFTSVRQDHKATYEGILHQQAEPDVSHLNGGVPCIESVECRQDDDGLGVEAIEERTSCIEVVAAQPGEDFGIETEASAERCIKGERPKGTLGTHATSANGARSKTKHPHVTPLADPATLTGRC